MITVDFDTNFFVWLARSGDVRADRTVRALNSLEVRFVLSGTLWTELVWNTVAPEQDDALARRLLKLRNPPLTLIPGLDLDGLVGSLLEHGPSRYAEAERLRELARLSTMGETFGFSARSGLARRTGPAFMEANRDIFTDVGAMTADGAPRVPWEFLREVGAALGVQLPELPEPTREQLMDFALEIQARLRALAPDAMRRFDEEKRLLDSMVATDNRPREIVLGDRSKVSDFGHTVRDRDRASDFVEHADQVDLFQVDGAQMRLIRKPRPQHRLAELGLAERCFTAGSLYHAVSQVVAIFPPRSARR